MPIEMVPPSDVFNAPSFEPTDVTKKESPDFWSELAPAAFEQENIATAVMNRLAADEFDMTPEESEAFASGKWNPIEVMDAAGIEDVDQRKMLSNARSQRQYDWYQGRIDQDKVNRDMLHSAGLGPQLAAVFMAAGLDPALIPAMLLPVGYGTVGARIAKSSLAGASVAGASEVGLHEMQAERTIQESWMNIGGASLFGIVLGPLGSRFTPDEVAAARENIQSFIEMPDGAVIPGNSAGAAKVGDFDTAEFKAFSAKIDDDLADGKITPEEAATRLRNKQLDWYALKYGDNPAMRLLGKISPQLRVSVSRSIAARKFLEELVEDSYIRTKNKYGMTAGPAAETQIKALRMRHHADTIDAVDVHWIEYKKSGSTTIRNKDDFASEVYRTMRNDDLHDDPFVTAAAQKMRQLNNVVENLLIEQGLLKTRHQAIRASYERKMGKLDEDDALGRSILEEKMERRLAEVEEGAVLPFGDSSYAPRVYDFDKIVHNRIGFKHTIRNYLRKELNDEVKWNQIKDDIDMSLDETIRKITGSPHGYADFDLVPKIGHLEARKIRVPSEVLDDFLVTDIRDVMDSYMRGVTPGLVYKQRFGETNISAKLEEIADEYDRLIEAAGPHTRKAKALVKEQERVLKDLDGMAQIIAGTYARPDDPRGAFNVIGHRLRAWNFVTSLGSMTVSALPDIGQTIARIGFKPFAKGLYITAMAPKAAGIARGEARKWAAGLDMKINSRAHALMMGEEAYSAGRKLDRTIDRGVRGFSKLTLMTHWNAGWKQFAASMLSDELLGKMGKGIDTEKIAAAGISKAMQKRIMKQFDAHGEKGVLKIANTDRWTDREAATVFEGAMLKEADTAIVTPGAGDLPLAARTSVGKLAFQFKSFILTAQNRILYAGLQRHDADFFLGMTAMMGLGALSYGLYQYSRGEEVDTSLDAILSQSFARAGIVGYFGELNEIIYKATEGKASVGTALGLKGAQPVSTFMHGSVLERLMGPSWGKGEDVSKVIAALSTGEITESDLRSARRMVPMQNLFYFRRLANAIENSASNVLVE